MRRAPSSGSDRSPQIRTTTCPESGPGKSLGDDDCQANGNAAAAGNERAGGQRVGAVGAGPVRRPGRAGGAGTHRSLVPGRSMESGLGQRLGLGLASLPRLATPGRPDRPLGLGTLGTPAGVGTAAAASTGVGARCPTDVEPDRRGLGPLEQRNMDAHLSGHRAEPVRGAGTQGSFALEERERTLAQRESELKSANFWPADGTGSPISATRLPTNASGRRTNESIARTNARERAQSANARDCSAPMKERNAYRRARSGSRPTWTVRAPKANGAASRPDG